ncbi:valine--tRNA ligase [Euryarchaeota archaeon SM23-78]|nr:MAG: valine--tRNA ligase [Euryarchaeota archaeon SM23-78]MBW3000774.1 valine--tRNA ligase [Candidatus Woesearchaeota archaeon]
MLNKSYNAEKVEKKWQKQWEQEGIYNFDPKSKKPIYSIDTPPPYASSGHLHVGHALHYTQFEIIVRYRRMKGFNVYFPPCFDNNGLPTEKYVEEKFNISKKNTTRTEFKKLCLEESRKVEKSYADRVFRGLGHSYDWNLLYTTIDPEAQKVSQRSFIELVNQGDAYRSKEPTLWCPHHQTALAQAEVEDVQRSTSLYYVNFEIAEGKGKGKKISIATTRPEFLPACVGIFVHPDDERYKHLLEKEVTVPLFNYNVKVMKDETVDKEFGTGIMMVCTFGDNADIEKWKKHKLDLKMIINYDGTLNELTGKYNGMGIPDAKKAVAKDLKSQGLITKEDPLQQTVGTCWRCHTPLEFIISNQWFIRTLKYKNELIKQGKKIKWYPGFYRVRFEDWTKNLAWDWCISRQRFYGVPIPVWYCEKCEKPMLAELKDLPVDPTVDKPKKRCGCGSDKFKPEEDVFDTWMTSSMSPEIAVRWLEKPETFKKMFPLSLRPQSHDIIRTWAFYTILKAYLHFKSVPWRDIAIGTYVLDPKGKGMHKSKGNVVWTEDLLKKYNVDVVRYWVGTANWGEDLPFQEKDLITGKKFITKLWNSARFSYQHLDTYDKKNDRLGFKDLEIIDRWLLVRFNNLIKNVTLNFDKYNTGESKKIAEQFFWHVFCDYYLEIIKHRLYSDKKDSKQRLSAQHTLYTVFLGILKLFAPIIPHITEELFHAYYAGKDKEECKSIHISSWPEHYAKLKDEVAEQAGELVIRIIAEVRKYKTGKKMSLKEEIAKVVVETSFDIKKLKDDEYKSLEQDLVNTVKTKKLEIKKSKEFKVNII